LTTHKIVGSLEFFQYNTPFEDNHLLIKPINQKGLILFDLGDISKIPLKQLLKVRFLFISHFHMDHFGGFCTFLRNILKLQKQTFHFYGPKGTIEKICNAINAYEWNLLDTESALFGIYEIHENETLYLKPSLFHEIKKDDIKERIQKLPAHFCLLETPQYNVETAILDHKIPVLGFKINIKPTFKVDEKSLKGVAQGSWIKESQELLLQGKNLENSFIINENLTLSLNEIKERFFIPVPQKTIAYITDCILNDNNIKVFQQFLKDCYLLFIESHFLKKDSSLADQTYHLSTKDVAFIVRTFKIPYWILNHFSQRYVKSFSLEDFYNEVRVLVENK
jgi:ribonuclease Z